MRKAIASIEPDIVDFQHSWTWFETQYPSVLTLHNVESHRLQVEGRTRAHSLANVRAMERQGIQEANAVVTFSAEDSRRAHALATSRNARIFQVPLGHDPRSNDTRRKQRELMKNAAYVGSFDYPPNLEAASLLVEEWPRIRSSSGLERLLLIGRQARRYFESTDTVQVLSDVPDITGALQAADVLLVPLVTGGGVRVKIIEAFALGIPVISTELGIEGLQAANGLHAVIIHDPYQLADALRSIQSKAVRTRLADNAYRLWQDLYSPAHMANEMLTVYGHVLIR